MKCYFLILPEWLHSKEQINTLTPPHNPEGRCHISGFCVNAAEASSCPPWPLCSVCVCSSAPPVVRQTKSRGAEERDGEAGETLKHIKDKQSKINWSLHFFTTSYPAHCYWLGATHPLPKGWCSEASWTQQNNKKIQAEDRVSADKYSATRGSKVMIERDYFCMCQCIVVVFFRKILHSILLTRTHTKSAEAPDTHPGIGPKI